MSFFLKCRQDRSYFFFAVWFVLCLLVPQVPTSSGRAIHPFFNWNLFSKTIGPKWGLLVTRCDSWKSQFSRPLDIGMRGPYAEGVTRLTVQWRIEAIDRLFRLGGRKKGIASLRQLMRTNFPEYKNCEFVIYRQDFKGVPIENQIHDRMNDTISGAIELVEDSRIEL